MNTNTNQSSDKEFLTIRIEPEIKKQLQQIAQDDNRSLSNMVNLMLKRALKDIHAHA